MLVKVAEGNDRIDDLCEALAEFVGNTERAIEAEDRRRKEAEDYIMSSGDPEAIKINWGSPSPRSVKT